MICLIIKMLTAQWIGLRVVGGGCRLQMQSACLMAAKNSAQNLNVTARTEQIKCVNYGAIFSGKNIKQSGEEEGERGDKYSYYILPCLHVGTGNVATGHVGRARDDCILMDKLKINVPMGLARTLYLN